jgi:hypothetical protein
MDSRNDGELTADLTAKIATAEYDVYQVSGNRFRAMPFSPTPSPSRGGGMTQLANAARQPRCFLKNVVIGS